jgi:hypothetical protein
MQDNVKFLDEKQLESNPQGQDSYNNESSNNLLFQLQLRVFPLKPKKMLLNC